MQTPSAPLQNSYLNLNINFKEVADRISCRPCEVNELTLYYAVMVGTKDEDGLIDYDGTDESNPITVDYKGENKSRRLQT